MTTPTSPAAAYTAARTALRDAITFTDADLRPEAHNRKRAEMIRTALSTLAQIGRAHV